MIASAAPDPVSVYRWLEENWPIVWDDENLSSEELKEFNSLYDQMAIALLNGAEALIENWIVEEEAWFIPEQIPLRSAANAREATYDLWRIGIHCPVLPPCPVKVQDAVDEYFRVFRAWPDGWEPDFDAVFEPSNDWVEF